MTWKRVRTLWPRWTVVLVLGAAWAPALNGPVPDGWMYFMAASGAGLGFGITYTTWRRRIAERSERMAASEHAAAERPVQHLAPHDAPRVTYTVKEKLHEYRQEQKEMDIRLRETVCRVQTNRRLAACALAIAGGRELWPYLIKLL